MIVVNGIILIRILENQADKALESSVHNLSTNQQKEEDSLRKEAEERNNSMDKVEKSNFEWVLVGLKGQRTLIKRRKQNHTGAVPNRGRGYRADGGRMREERNSLSQGPQQAEGRVRRIVQEVGERESVKELVRETQRTRRTARETEASQLTEAKKVKEEKEKEKCDNTTKTETEQEDSLLEVIPRGDNWNNGDGGRGGGGGGEPAGDPEQYQGPREEEQRGHLPKSTTAQPEEQELKTLKLVYLNARSLTSKLNDLAILINDHNPDVILITETWLKENITNAMLNIPGFSI